MVPSPRRSIDTAGSPNEIARSGWPPSDRAAPSVDERCAGFRAHVRSGFTLAVLRSRKARIRRFCFLVALRHRRHQRFHQQPGLRIGFRDHRQRLQHGEIRQRRIVRDTCSASSIALRQRVAFFDQILRKAVGTRLRWPNRPVRSASYRSCGQRQSIAAAVPTRRRRQRCRAGLRAARNRLTGFGDADMRGTGKLQPAADHRAA